MCHSSEMMATGVIKREKSLINGNEIIFSDGDRGINGDRGNNDKG